MEFFLQTGNPPSQNLGLILHGNLFTCTEETCLIIWSLQIVVVNSEEHKKMTAVVESDSSLASKCLDFCQALASQGNAFNFSLSIGSTFSFSLDTRNKSLDTKVGPLKKKKPSPSTLRRNARRREEFLKKKQNPSPSSSSAAGQVGASQLLQLHVPDGRRRVMSVGRIEMPPISFHKLEVTSTPLRHLPNPLSNPLHCPHQHLHQPTCSL